MSRSLFGSHSAPVSAVENSRSFCAKSGKESFIHHANLKETENIMAATLPVKKTESIPDELNGLRNRITQRAFEIFEANGHALGRDLEDWLAAERELIWKPPIELEEKNGEFRLEIAAPGLDTRDIDIQVSPNQILVKAQSRHEHSEEKGPVHICEFASGSLFRSIELPKTIDTDKVKAEFKNGMLTLTAAVAREEKARAVELKAT
jgi:HSP20 family protein